MSLFIPLIYLQLSSLLWTQFSSFNYTTTNQIYPYIEDGVLRLTNPTVEEDPRVDPIEVSGKIHIDFGGLYIRILNIHFLFLFGI